MIDELQPFLPPPGMRLRTARYLVVVVGALAWLVWRGDWIGGALVLAVVIETGLAGVAAINLATAAQRAHDHEQHRRELEDLQ